ncbi:MAG: type II toxin-antitoxin system prevent-host-death family antitoxin [Armatimonadetes bacterium]|nr:type II toxin-antitoxin system prevent-host-death family antitoxin [Armatimonadota bacterium]
MKVVEVTEAADRLSECIQEAQRERILVTRGGRPAALITGIEGYDLEDILLASDPSFWQMIQERRQEESIDRDEILRRLAAAPSDTEE